MNEHPKFFTELCFQFKGAAFDPRVDKQTKMIYRSFVQALESQHCKRLIFDARQAKVFDETGSFSETKKAKIKPPFDFFYLEFTDPIVLQAQEPGELDQCFGVLYSSQQNDFLRIQGAENVPERLEENTTRYIDATKATFFFRGKPKDGKEPEWIDRTWSIAPEGYPMVGRRLDAHEKDRTKNDLMLVQHDIKQEALPAYCKKGEFFNVYKIDPAQRGWWEQAIISYTDLLYWCFAFMMAKSVRIEEVPVSRQVRRALERQNKVPNPWHVVKVEPRTNQRVETVGGEGAKHSYRYDVIGHLRFTKHKTRDGWRDSIEWVSDHQRGLENELYIPKTYKVESGRKIDDARMAQYWGGEK